MRRCTQHGGKHPCAQCVLHTISISPLQAVHFHWDHSVVCSIVLVPSSMFTLQAHHGTSHCAGASNLCCALLCGLVSGSIIMKASCAACAVLYRHLLTAFAGYCCLCMHLWSMPPCCEAGGLLVMPSHT